MLTDAAGEVTIEVPRDRAGTFEPVIVKKRQKRLTDVDAVAISLYAKGLTTGEISAHFAEVYGASISKDTISRITDGVVEEMQSWSSRPLQGVCGDLHRRDHDHSYRAGRAVLGTYPAVLCRGRGRSERPPRRLGLWAGHGSGESAKFSDVRAHRHQEPRRGRCVLHRL